MLRKISVTLIAAGSVISAVAQTEKPSEEKTSSTTISGNADVYYRYDFGQTKSNNYTSFTNSHNSFELGMASVKIEHKTSKVSMVADLGFGSRARDFSYNDEGIVAAIKQLYISYSPKEWLKFTAGSWATHVGYEVADPYLNRNYSTSYMFSNGPFFHTGIKGEMTHGKHGFMLGIANPTDFKTAPSNGVNKKFALAQYSYAASENVKAYLNYVGGEAPDSSKSNQFDLVVSAKLNDLFSLGYNGTVATVKIKEGGKYNDSKTWWGSAVYLNLDPKSWLGFCLRGEYFSDKNQLKVYGSQPEGGSIFATTLSANFKIDQFILIPELRVDNASKKIFTNKNGDPVSSAGSFLVAAIYQF